MGCTICYGSKVAQGGYPCIACAPRLGPIAQPSIQNPPAVTGWVCPSCKSVYAPFVQRCYICGPKPKAGL